jgi:tetratricopeptide (TPR) repeat protein
VPTRSLLAQTLLNTNQQAEAIEEYRKLLEYNPDNVSALNNLAWLYQEENNPEGIKYAKRAYELVPNRPEVIDTLGWLLVQNGETNRGLVLLQEAATKAPHIPDIRYHMAAALEKAGRRDEARKELDRLLKSNKAFPERDKAAALRAQLDN